jgi:hypothetical protein
MARQGCDVVDHGWRWLDYHGIDEATEREHICLGPVGAELLCLQFRRRAWD